MSNKFWWLTGETLAIVFLPLYVFFIRPDLLQWRVPFMAGMLVYVALVTAKLKFSSKDFGLARGNKKGWRLMFLATFLLAAGLYVALKINPEVLFVKEMVIESMSFGPVVSLLIYVVLSAPLQEFLIRGYYLARLQDSIEHHYLVLILVSLIFGLLHAPFANPWLSFGTFLMSFFWTWFVMKYKTIYPVIFSHIILGGIIMAASLW